MLPERLTTLSSPARLSPIIALMPGSQTVEQNLTGVLARVGEISTSEEAQKFADVVSGVYFPPFNYAIFNH